MGNITGRDGREQQYPVREQVTRGVSTSEYIFSEYLNRSDQRIPLRNERNSQKLISIRRSKAVQNQCHINGRTICYIPSLRKLRFEYDCIQDSVLNIYNTDSLDERLISTEKPISSHSIPKSLNKRIEIDLIQDLRTKFLLEVKPKGLQSNQIETIQLTFCERSSANDSIEVKRQCVLYNGKAFEIQNVFGLSNGATASSNDEDSEKCVVCLTSNRETILLPCRHACLCAECSKSLFKNTQECPICRKSVIGLVNIDNDK
ncbi:RING domain-containing protein [Cryptosporidium canis]|uniref:RING domain-containing protein n=1 Tax=Cryptosporidium canis TaxID=195482 RepID=A0A9D5DN33_9CRYT|nr:RING domain-containing protein [Cryptosporidium canis]